MKVYVFGNDKDACIELANQLNDNGASAHIAKEGEGLREVASRIGKLFDVAVMVSADPIKDSITANRDSKVRAAVCYNQKALKAAANAEVNLFILEPDAQDKLDISDILANASQGKQPAVQKEKEREREREEQPTKKEQKRQQPPPEPKTRPKDDDDDSPAHNSSGGVGGKIKDLFGIEE